VSEHLLIVSVAEGADLGGYTLREIGLDICDSDYIDSWMAVQELSMLAAQNAQADYTCL
jgi:hypothetical protein